MGTRQSLLFICVFITNLISPLNCEVYSYPARPLDPALSATRPRARLYTNRCSRITIPNGSMILKHRGRVAKFTCNPGYKLIGDNIATCHQRKWDAVPNCVKDVQCPEEIPKVMNGRMIEYSYVYFKIICNDGYRLPDNVQSIYPCEEFSRPDAKPPVCQLSDSLYCDFEVDTCGWNNSIPYFSWIRYQNATPSHELHTGPGGDHTSGTGHYLYIEASGLPDNEERYAKITRFFKQVDTPEVCFVFWYHMYGYNIGTLDVYVDFNKVFSKSGNLGDKWRKGIVQRLPSDRDFYISVMATTANGFAGDIAIDDIGLVNSTDCTKTILVDTTCKGRCFERGPNPKLCKCSSECLIEGTCCTDFMHFCSNDAFPSTSVGETTEWKTSDAREAWSDSMSSTFETSESSVWSGWSTEMYSGSSPEEYAEDAGAEGMLVTSTENVEGTIISHGSTIALESVSYYYYSESIMSESSIPELSGDMSTFPEKERVETTSTKSWISLTSSMKNVTEFNAIQSTAHEKDPESQDPGLPTTAVSPPSIQPNPGTPPPLTITSAPSPELKLTSATDLKTTITAATKPKLVTTSEKPSDVLTSYQTSATSSTVDHTNCTSTSASHTHLPPDYDEFDDDATEVSTEYIQPTQFDQTPPLSRARITDKPFKWRKTYEPKGRYTFSAVKSENKTTTYVSIVFGVTAFLATVVAAAYIFKRRRAIRFRDATEESDVLYMTSDEILDFNIARRPTSGPSQNHPTPSQHVRVCQSDFSFTSSNVSS